MAASRALKTQQDAVSQHLCFFLSWLHNQAYWTEALKKKKKKNTDDVQVCFFPFNSCYL